MTGFISIYGQTEKEAIDYAVREINQSGGIDSKSLKIIYEDSGSDAQTALTAAKKLVELDGVSIILGGTLSSETLSIAPYAQEKGILMFSSVSTSSHVSKYENIFRNTLDTYKDGIKLVNLAQLHKLGQVVVITENNDYPRDIRDGLMLGLEQSNIQVLLDELFHSGKTDFKTEITKMKQLSPDAIFMFAFANSAGNLVKQIYEANLSMQIYSVEIPGTNDFLEVSGKAAEGIIFVDVPAINDNNRKLQKILNQFKEKNISPVGNYFVAARYDSIQILKKALENCGQDNGCIADYLRNNKHQGLLGEYGFDENGDMTGLEVSFKQIVDGKPVVYEP